MELFVRLNMKSGIKSVILLTREPDIAAYSNQHIRFSDDCVVSNIPTT
ncbi:MAG: hypothetical protein HQL04_05210 [Nitrospirae bacterium]|nr:hypothetical protein [Nitrospirota bacterium]